MVSIKKVDCIEIELALVLGGVTGNKSVVSGM